jgi:hypothetical protein
MAERIIRIGGASGAWGDSPRAIPQLLGSAVDYLMMDYLAEVTMSLLARARMKDPAAGYPTDFVLYLRETLPEISRRKIRIVSNAGGVNPAGCKAALQAICRELGLSLSIAVVEGDDLLPLVEKLRASGIREDLTGLPLPQRLLTANAYLGALPIKGALDNGADIVITGRCADSALALGILMHEFEWSERDYDRLSAGSLAGHLLECGPQSTGGLFTDWETVPDWHNIGYPIAECRVDGSFVLTKPASTGGLVTPGTVAEQALYEIGDPAAYILPDVIADFSQVRLTEVGPDRVLVTGARGRPPTDLYKVSSTYQDGYRAVATVSIVGIDAARKARRTAEALLARARMTFRERGVADFVSTHIEELGADAAYGRNTSASPSREVLLRMVVVHHDRKAIDLFARELGSVGISFAPGTTGIYGGRPKATPLIRLCTFFVKKADIPQPSVMLDNKTMRVEIPAGQSPVAAAGAPRSGVIDEVAAGPTVEVPLIKLALARSGDKGNLSNIAIIARDPALLPVLRREVTSERIAAHFRDLVGGPVHRYEAPGLGALNFVLEDALGGGGMASSRIDPQGKAFGQMALEMKVQVPAALLAKIG